MSAYAEAVAYLAGLEAARGWDLSLERMRAALALCGHPERAVPAIHVAGTNGKGSTAAMVEAALRAGGWRTGLYTSPHLVDFAERIRAGGRTIPRDTVAREVGRLRTALEDAGIGLTHFEFVTLLAFVWFARIGVDVAVLEVGLGGRLDATNVAEPACCVITPIARDHEAFLGTTLAAIAAEKAGILKAGVPACMGRLVPEAADVVRARADALGVPLVCAGRDGVLARAGDGWTFQGPTVRWEGLGLALPGRFQEANAELALLALDVAGRRWPLGVDAVRRGLASVAWPGRLARVREHPLVVLDGAHNPAAVAALAAELPALLAGRAATLVFAAMQDKAWREEIEMLLPHANEVVVTRVGRRGEDPHAIAAAVGARRPVGISDDAPAAIASAIERAGAAGAVIVTGSLFLVGAAYAALGETLFETWHGWEGDGTEARR